MLERSILSLCAFALLAAPGCVVKVNNGSTSPDGDTKPNGAESTEKVAGDDADADADTESMSKEDAMRPAEDEAGGEEDATSKEDSMRPAEGEGEGEDQADRPI